MKMISISELEETLEMDEWMGLDRHRNQPVVYIKYSSCLWEGETAQILLIKKLCMWEKTNLAIGMLLKV